MATSEVVLWARERYPLHLAVWENDVARLTALLQDPSVKNAKRGERRHIDELDNRGNAPLHLAIMLNRQECLRLLLEHANPDCRLKNRDGWSPLAEAISFANVDLLRYVYLKRIQQSRRIMDDQMPMLFSQLTQLPDFQLEMHWEFRSWIPFLSNLCPSDVNRICKRGASVRLDTTIAGFERMKWVRGNLSFMMIGPQQGGVDNVNAMSVSQLKGYLEQRGFSYQDCIEKSDLIGKVHRVMRAEASRHSAAVGKLVLLDHDNKKYATVTDDPHNFDEFESMLQLMLTQPKTTTELVRDHFQCRRVRAGLWGWQGDKIERVGDYDAHVYEISGVQFVTKVRTEHMAGSARKDEDEHVAGSATEEDVDWEEEARKMEASLKEANQMDGQVPTDNEGARGAFSALSATLPPPPPPTTATPERYFDLNSGPLPPLGRPHRMRVKSKNFKGKMWTSDDFPISIKDFMPVLQTLERSSVVFSKLLEFLSLDLPPGFPVRLEVPVLPVLSVLITFRKYSSESPDEVLFKLPIDYNSLSQNEMPGGRAMGLA